MKIASFRICVEDSGIIIRKSATATCQWFLRLDLYRVANRAALTISAKSQKTEPNEASILKIKPALAAR